MRKPAENFANSREFFFSFGSLGIGVVNHFLDTDFTENTDFIPLFFRRRIRVIRVQKVLITEIPKDPIYDAHPDELGEQQQFIYLCKMMERKIAQIDNQMAELAKLRSEIHVALEDVRSKIWIENREAVKVDVKP